MAYKLQELTPEQRCLPLRVGVFYTTGTTKRWWDMELLSVDETLGMCRMRQRGRVEVEFVRVSYLRKRFKVRAP